MNLRCSFNRGLLGLSIALAPVAPSQAQATQTTAVLIENVRIFNGTANALSAPSNVLVVGNRISKISTAPIATEPGHRPTIVKGGGRTLMPGLIDNHAHITLSASSQRDLIDPKIAAETLQARAVEEASQMLLRGFTAVRDLGVRCSS
jgi:imidazolonepropionase-like amidohydrolase